MPRRTAVLFSISLLLAFAGGASAQTTVSPFARAQPGALRVFVMTGLEETVMAVQAQAEGQLGKPIATEYGASRGVLRDEILAGQDFEVAILLPDTNAELLRQGKLAPGTYGIAKVPVALGLRGDAPPDLDVHTPEGLKKALLGARSVKYGPTGAALGTVKSVFSTLKLDGKVKDTSTLIQDVALAPGEYEIAFYPFSEIPLRKSLRNLGPVIAPMQVPTEIEAAVGAHANDRKAALAFIRFLQGPATDASLAEYQMVRVK
jgi:molybdate transport system substrate-binding protein